jgi:glycine C-acetyltransferase
VHKQLENRLSAFFMMQDTVLYSSCFDANGGVFETLFGAEDAIISDALNHASIIDGIRLCKAQRHRYTHNDMDDLERKLFDAKNARYKVIATDGVFSMDGTIADLASICKLAHKHQALVMVDDCHAAGFMGEHGRGTPEHCGVMDKIDILTGTLGKALGGASGGYISGRRELIGWLRQKSRPYLFSNTLAPAIAAATLKVLDLVEEGDALRRRLHDNSTHFRKRMTEAGFKLLPGSHPIVPVMLGEAKLAQEFASRLLGEGIYVVGFFYPVVPEGKARIRVQLSAAHTSEQVDKAVNAFISVGRTLKVLF